MLYFWANKKMSSHNINLVKLVPTNINLTNERTSTHFQHLFMLEAFHRGWRLPPWKHTMNETAVKLCFSLCSLSHAAWNAGLLFLPHISNLFGAVCLIMFFNEPLSWAVFSLWLDTFGLYQYGDFRKQLSSLNLLEVLSLNFCCTFTFFI